MAEGFQCRDDITGEPTRPVVLSGYGEGAASPYYSDRFVGISGNTAAVVFPTFATDSVSVNVFPVRGTDAIADAKVDVSTTSAEGSRYPNFVVGSGQLANGATLVLLRRIDLKTDPLLAISVTPGPTAPGTQRSMTERPASSGGIVTAESQTMDRNDYSDRVVQASVIVRAQTHCSLSEAFGVMGDHAQAVNTTIEHVALTVLGRAFSFDNNSWDGRGFRA